MTDRCTRDQPVHPHVRLWEVVARNDTGLVQNHRSTRFGDDRTMQQDRDAPAAGQGVDSHERAALVGVDDLVLLADPEGL